MFVSHQSDSHGTLLPITHRNIDALIHTGDLCPDPDISKGSKPEVVQYWQQKWVMDKLEAFKSWIRERAFLFTLGNHDWCGAEWLEAELRTEGIDAHCLHDKVVAFKGLNLYGLPYIPVISGYHAYEENVEGMQAKIDAMVKAINGPAYVDVIAAHCPPFQIVDQDLRNGLHWGNKLMNDALWNAIEADKLPHHYMCGHCHSANSVRMVSKNGRTMLFSNAATQQHILELS